jgi:hypothetical protein
MRAALIGFGLAIAVVATACSASPATAPTEARNDGDLPRIVRLVGSTGSVDLAVPAHGLVRLNAPASIGTVREAWMTYEDCAFKGGGQIYGDGTNGRAAFEAGGLLVFDSSMSFSGTTGWVGTTPPPAPDAEPATVCASVPTPISWSSR